MKTDVKIDPLYIQAAYEGWKESNANLTEEEHEYFVLGQLKLMLEILRFTYGDDVTKKVVDEMLEQQPIISNSAASIGR